MIRILVPPNYVYLTRHRHKQGEKQRAPTCCTSRPRAQTSVVIRTRVVPLRNSAMIASRSFWGMSPCIADTVKLLLLIFSVSQSTCTKQLLSLQPLINDVNTKMYCENIAPLTRYRTNVLHQRYQIWEKNALVVRIV
jgi:hypothetical protein